MDQETTQYRTSVAGTPLFLPYKIHGIKFGCILDSRVHSRDRGVCGVSRKGLGLYLGATQLELGGVDFPPQQLVESRVPSQDDWLVCPLHTPTQNIKVYTKHAHQN